MKTIVVLGTSSNSGKSWVATALCAWLAKRGCRVAPFKAQNMSNNACATLDGGEIGRAQAAQAEACGLLPERDMNPVLLKPSGPLGSQVILLGEPEGHMHASEYYSHTERFWAVASAAMDRWRSRCDVLVVEGAGSPVELNLMDRDLANLRPLRHGDGCWILVADIERGGVFAQIAGTWALIPPADRAAGLGAVINKFRGDLSLFRDPGHHLAPHTPLPVLGTLPYAPALQPESEDSLCEQDENTGSGALLAWVRFPSVANTSDSQPWRMDTGVSVRWVSSPAQIAKARAIVLPGSRNTMADLAWFRESGCADAVSAAAARGVPVLGICGGYQMLGRTVSDPDGRAGSGGSLPGLGLLPVETRYRPTKTVAPRRAFFGEASWDTYEIHMGETRLLDGAAPLLSAAPEGGQPQPEGCRAGRVWGTYLHGFFESAATRRAFMLEAGCAGHTCAPTSWAEERRTIYSGMADLLETHLDLGPIRRHVGI